MDLVVVGRRVRALRQKRGWSIATLAEKSDVHENTLGGLERGDAADIGTMLLGGIAKALGVELAELIAAEAVPRRPRRARA